MSVIMSKRSKHMVLFFLGLMLLFNLRLASFTSRNQIYLSWEDLSLMFGVQIFAFMVIALMLRLMCRNWDRALYILTYVTLFWVLGAAAIVLVTSEQWLVAALYITFLGVVFYVVHHCYTTMKEGFRKTVYMFSFIMFAMQLPGIVSILQSSTVDYRFDDIEHLEMEAQEEDLPHILYIVPDRYSSNQNLRDLYNFSNDDFTDALKEKGFHVWDNQFSNYPKTFMSMASTFNMNYLDPALASIPKDSERYQFMYGFLEDYQVRRELHKNGYRYTHIGSWWNPTKRNAFADVNYNQGVYGLSEAVVKYLSVTPLAFVLKNPSGKSVCDIVEEKIDLIRKTVTQDKPQFILWHNLITHPPYIYASDGRCRKGHEERYFFYNYKKRNENYVNHIQHFNQKIMALIDDVFKHSTREVIIVIQSDEGPFPEAYVREDAGGDDVEEYNFWDSSLEEIKRKQGVFNAIYLPSRAYDGFDAYQTPVNNFRHIFREIYSADIPLLDDKIYSFEYERLPYDLKDISQPLLKRQQ